MDSLGGEAFSELKQDFKHFIFRLQTPFSNLFFFLIPILLSSPSQFSEGLASYFECAFNCRTLREAKAGLRGKDTHYSDLHLGST